MQRIVFAVVAPRVIEIFDTEIVFDDVRVSAPAPALPRQLSLPLYSIDDELVAWELVVHEEDLCAH